MIDPRVRTFLKEQVPFVFEESATLCWGIEAGYPSVAIVAGTNNGKIYLHDAQGLRISLVLYHRKSIFYTLVNLYRKDERILQHELTIDPIGKNFAEVLQAIEDEITPKMLNAAIAKQEAKFAQWEAEYQEALSKRQLEGETND